MKPRQVPLDLVVVERAEQAHARLVIREQKSAEVAVKTLDTGANGREIKIRRLIREAILDEGFLKSDPAVSAMRAVADILLVISGDADAPAVRNREKIVGTSIRSSHR